MFMSMFSFDSNYSVDLGQWLAKKYSGEFFLQNTD